MARDGSNPCWPAGAFQTKFPCRMAFSALLMYGLAPSLAIADRIRLAAAFQSKLPTSQYDRRRSERRSAAQSVDAQGGTVFASLHSRRRLAASR